MQKIAEEPWAWILYQNKENFFISVICGTVGIFEANIKLDAEEVKNYQKDGLVFIREMARAITNNPQKYWDRQIKNLDEV